MAKKKQKRKERKERGHVPRRDESADMGDPDMSGIASDRPDVVPLIQRIEELRGSRVISYHLDEQAAMSDGAMPTLFRQLRAVGRQARIDLLLHSRGGHTVVAWRVVQAVRSYCEHFGVLVPYRAHSAATHVAMGADEIVMGPFSELGPVDPFRDHPLLPPGQDGKPVSISVQDLKHAMAFIKREAGEDGLSGEAFAQVVTALFQHVHPLAVGAIEQSYELAKLISRKVLSTHMNAEEQASEIQRIANTLSDDFKEHTYQIGAREAKDLGLKVSDAPPDVYDAMWALFEYYTGLDRTPKPGQLATSLASAQPPGQRPTAGQMLVTRIGHLDSAERRADCQLFLEQSPDGSIRPVGDRWVLL